MPDDTANPGVEGSAEPPAGLVEAMQRAYGRWIAPVDCLAILVAIREWDAVEARVAKGGCPVERRDCDGPGSYYCDAELWGSACRRFFEQRREATR